MPWAPSSPQSAFPTCIGLLIDELGGVSCGDTLEDDDGFGGVSGNGVLEDDADATLLVPDELGSAARAFLLVLDELGGAV